MELEEFFDVFMEELRSNAIENGSLKAQEFLTSSLERIVDYGDLDDYDIIDYNSSADNLKPIHAFCFNDIFKQLTLVVNLFDDLPTDELKNLTASELTPPFNRAVRFLKDALNKNPEELAPSKTDLYYFVKQLKESWPNIKEVKIIFITNKPLSKRFAHKDKSKIDKRNVAYGIWDLRRFYEVEISGSEREEIEVDTSDAPLPSLVASASEQITSYLVVMPATKLAEIYGQYKSRVLEQNVRSFLQNRSNVNKGIRITLEKVPERFFAYNNGITATAQEAEFNSDGHITKLKNLQIVNGGQTTAQVYNGAKAGLNLEKVSVQMKLNVIKDLDVVDEIVPNIAKFANSQNPVSEADLSSNAPFQIWFEKISRDTIPPVIVGKAFSERWFFERSRGQYLNEQSDMTPAAKREFQRFHPKHKMITKTDLALVLNSWGEKPYQVSKGAQANFKDFATSLKGKENSSGIYNARYFYSSISKTIVFREFRKEIPKQEWYNGFPANIATYSISWLAYCMRETGLSLNIDKIWKDQIADKVLIMMLLSVAEEVNRHLLAYAGNPTTYAKSEKCWKEMINSFDMLDIQEDDQIFLSSEKANKIDEEAKQEQGALNELTNEVILWSIHPDCWLEIKKFNGRKMSESKNSDIEKLRRGELIPDFKIKPLANFVRAYQKAGGEIIYKDGFGHTVT